MFKNLIWVFSFVAICYYEIPKMRKSNMKKELVLFSIVMLIAAVINFLQINGVEIPNPLDGLRAIFSPIGLGIETFFKS